ncbi:restriction endonuclease [Pseudomonas sp. CYM-20-01]|uniref:BsuBI/PstI family type II restriction endonuclease n=1 Tax=Pseudomonas sp. CYM-20-01 TaxID=2870750 RepID=UPI0020606809|nr:BsuBI/PstI family type II restriction endonuclease [Pseudomonas sp. CYM-20-01]BDB16749.1 restriction endonuclease [Pseudomonas sp. CYM-20-01]
MLPPYASRALIAERLPIIFPEGTPNRTYCIREITASTVFAMLYIGAVEGEDVWLGPVHVYRMTDVQAEIFDDAERLAYRMNLRKKSYQVPGSRWYADNTREPIRDETLREGLLVVGAVIEKAGVPTTSGAPRYALKKDLAALFDPRLVGEALEVAILAWQKNNLSHSARARVSLMRAGTTGKGGVIVSYPNGDTRRLASGPSSDISKAVVEVFAVKFLEMPGVIWLSESGNKTAHSDIKLASSIGLDIQANKDLPDLILVDVGSSHPLIVFVEVVASDGAITPRRQEALYAITDKGGFDRSQVTFVTAYADRESAGYKKTMPGLAWGSFAWFMSEPDNLVILRRGARLLADLNLDTYQPSVD